ncbi:unnamed protein product [Closterium sp. NIES-53]
MALLRVLAFDHEGRPVQFDTWLDDLQLYLLSDSKDSVSLFDLASGAATAPPATADSSTRSQWLTHAVGARYSSPATAALGRLLLPYLFPELSAFTTVEDLVSHLRASDARYRAAIPAEFLDRNQPSMYITLYFIVTRLPDSLRSVRDHFLSLDPTSLTVDLFEQHLLAAETSAVAVGAARGTPRPPFFEGCSPSPLAPSYASAAAADVSVPEDVGAASASAKRRSTKGKGGQGGGGGSGSGDWGSSGGGGGGATVGGSGGSGGGGGGSGGSGGSGGGGTGSGGTGARRVDSGGGQRQQQQRRSETPSPQQLREWFLRGASGGSCPYVIRTGDRAGQTCGRLHTQHRCFSCLDDAWRAEFGDDVELPRWADLLKSRIAIFDLDFDAILSAMYALSVSAKGDCYPCVPPDPGIADAALGASESGTLPGTAAAEALHTFTLDSGASRCFFRDSTTLTPLPAPVPVRLADPSGGPVVARSSTFLPCPAVPSGSLSGLHLPSFSTKLVSTAALQGAMVTTTTPGGSILYTLATEPSQVAASAQVSASGQVAASCSCRLLSHQTLLWHHRLGHPSLPRLRGMHSRLLSRERYFLLVVDDYTQYTTVFPLCSKGQVVDVLIPWIRTVRLQLRERFGQDLPVLRLHSNRGVLPPHLASCPPISGRHGPAPSGVSQVDPLPGPAPVQVAVVSCATPGAASRVAASGGAEPGGAGSEGAGSGGAEPEGVEPGGAESEGVVSGVAEPRGAASPGGPAGASPRLSQQQLREWLVRRPHRRSGAPGAGGAGDTRAGGAAVPTGAVGTGGVGCAGAVDPTDPRAADTVGAGAGVAGVGGPGAGGAGAAGAGVGGTGAGGAGAAGAGAVDPGAGSAGDTVRPRPYFVPLLQQVLGVPSTGLPPPFLCPLPDQSQPLGRVLGRYGVGWSRTSRSRRPRSRRLRSRTSGSRRTWPRGLRSMRSRSRMSQSTRS